MKNQNVFMARKKQYGSLPTGSKAKPKRAEQPKQKPTVMQRHDQSINDRDLGNAWWLTMMTTPWFKQRVEGSGKA